MKKRLLSALLAVCMMLSLLPTTVLAATVSDPLTASVGDTTTTPNNEKPEAPTGSVWVNTSVDGPDALLGISAVCGKKEHTHSEDCYDTVPCEHKHATDCFTSYERCYASGYLCSHAFHYKDGYKTYGATVDPICGHHIDCLTADGTTYKCASKTYPTYKAHTHMETDNADTSCYRYTWTLYADANNNGKGDGTFEPQGSATRAQVAKIFMEFVFAAGE